jgi:hypothetical protein
LGGATAALNYTSGAGSAGIEYTDAGNGSQLVMLAFPFETITTEANRVAVMARVVQYFQLSEAPSEIEIVLDNDQGTGVYTETGTWTTSGLDGYNGTTFRFANTGSDAQAEWRFTAPFAGQAEVFVQYRASANRATHAAYEIDTGDGVALATADQTTNSLTWVSLGTYFIQPGERTITLNALASYGGNAVNADAVRIVLTAASAPNGDFDDDGQVDGRDFLAWQRGAGTVDATLEQGDANGDGQVDGGDLTIWQNQFGGVATLTEASSSASLSPSTMGLIALAQHQMLVAPVASLSTPNEPPAEDAIDALNLPAMALRKYGETQPATTDADASGTRGSLDAMEDQGSDANEPTDAALRELSDWTWRLGVL